MSVNQMSKEPRLSSDVARPHVIDGQFQSDKYPTCPPGKVPLSVRDPTAQDLLWQYAQRRRSVDAEFASDLEHCLQEAGYLPPSRSCDDLVSFADGELDPARTDAFREHLRTCTTCQGRLTTTLQLEACLSHRGPRERRQYRWIHPTTLLAAGSLLAVLATLLDVPALSYAALPLVTSSWINLAMTWRDRRAAMRGDAR